MPLPLPRQGNPRVYLPGYRSLSYGGFDSAVASFSRATSGGTFRAPKFEPGQIASIDKSGFQLNANQLISLGIKQPAYALEAPLRPLDVVTGGAVSGVLKGVSDTIGKIPVLSNILGAAGEGLQFLDNVGAALPNHQLAEWLSRSIGKPDNYLVVNEYGHRLTAGEIRARAEQQWATDQKGNPFTIRELEARAKTDPWSFGEFSTSVDAGGDIINRLITNPLNLLFVPGLAGGAVRAAGAGAKYLADASQAAKWARPLIKPISAAAPFRYGYGYAAAMGRGTGAFLKEAHNPTPMLREFLDVNAGATAIMNGNLRSSGTMKSLLTATAWMSRGAKAIYLPGINTELKGARLAGSAARAWMRGGIQQELVGAGAEYLFGGIDNYLNENGMDHTFIGGVTSAIHDGLSEIMNDHPLSDNNAFVLAALFLPTAGAAKDILSPAKTGLAKRRYPLYTDNVASNLREKLNKNMGAKFAKNDDMFAAIGDGDLAKGKAIFEFWTDTTEVLKAQNQFSHFLQQVASAEVDGLATLSTFFSDNIRTNIERRRKTGALQPKSTADYMFEQHFKPGAQPGKVELASEVSGTADSFMREMRNMYAAREAIGPQLLDLGLDITKGARLDRERLDAIIAEVMKTPEGLVDANLARQIIDMGPSLVYDNEFFRGFGVSLGQEAHGGVTGKAVMASERVTRDDLVARLTEIRDKLPSQQELFHETIRASKAQGVAKNQVFRIHETPYPLGEKVKANRLKATTRVEQLSDNERVLSTARTNEYFKSGKPKFSTAAEITGPDGGVFKRVEPSPTIVEPKPPEGIGYGPGLVNPETLASSDPRMALWMKYVEEHGKYVGRLARTAEDALDMMSEDRVLGIIRDEPIILSSSGSFARGLDFVPESRAPTASVLEGLPSGEPGGILFRDVKTVKTGAKKQAIWYGPDGSPRAYAQARIDAKGNARELSVYVDPEFRRRGIATMLYDKFKLEGIDLSKVSGSIVTAEGKAFTDKYWSKVKKAAAEKPGTAYARSDGVSVAIKKGVVSIAIPADREATLLAELDKTLFKSGPRKGTIKPGMEEQSAKLNLQIEAARMGIDTEALVLAAQNVGRIFVADAKAGDLLASYGFVESARVGDTGMAAYSFRGGDPAKILENRAAGSFSPYRPTKRVASEKGAIGVARRDALNASMYTDATHYIGKSSNPTRTLFPEERLRYIKEQAEATKDAYAQELKSVAAIDEIAFDMLPFDKKITDMNLQEWADALSTKEYGKVRDFFRDSYSQYPNLSLTRREPGMVVDPADSRFSTLVTTKNRWQEIFMDYGPLSPIQRIYDALLAPVGTRWLGKQTQTEVHNLLATVGWEPGASRDFIAKLRARVLESRAVKGVASITGSHTYRSVEALPEETLRAIAREVAPEQAQAVIDRWGAYQKMLTEASNRLLRSVQRKGRMGGSLNPIEKAADATFRFYQYAPGVEKVSFATQRLTKFVYPWFRFHSDPFFHLMNFTEPSIYAILNNGWKGLQKPSEGIPRRMELSSAGLIPPGGLYAKDAPADLLLADAGTYTAPHNILPRLQREYELTTDKKAVELFNLMTKEHPVAQMMRERFGDNIPDWAAEMNRLMENLVKKPEDMVRAEWKATLETELGYTHAELKQLAPIAERLTEIYRGVHNDLTDLYIGRMNRSNMERLANTFFLAFPVSYMIKATTWAYRILFEKLGPVNGSAGAYLWDQYRQKYENALENDPSFAKWTQDNGDFLFALEMTMPITPASIGLNLNKTTRYVGSFLSREWLGIGTDPGEFDIPTLVGNATRVGPARTWALADRLLKSWQVPGFYHPKPVKIPTITPT